MADILGDNPVNGSGTLLLHSYEHQKGAVALDDVAEILEVKFDEWKLDQEYELQGVLFSVVEKTATHIKVVIKLPINLLAYNLIRSAKGQRLMMIQGRIGLGEYVKDQGDEYAGH